MRPTASLESRLGAMQKVVEALRDMNPSDQRRILMTVACFLDLGAALDAEADDAP